MNFEDYNLDQIEILTNRSIKTSIVSIVLNYDAICIRASKSCFRSIESELDTERDILESLGFSDKQITELSYE